MCPSLDMEGYRRALTLQNHFGQWCGEWRFPWESLLLPETGVVEAQHQSKEWRVRWMGWGSPKVKVQNRKGQLYSWYLKTHWFFEWIVGGWRSDSMYPNLKKYEQTWKAVWISCDVNKLPIPVPFAKKYFRFKNVLLFSIPFLLYLLISTPPKVQPLNLVRDIIKRE